MGPSVCSVQMVRYAGSQECGRWVEARQANAISFARCLWPAQGGYTHTGELLRRGCPSLEDIRQYSFDFEAKYKVGISISS